MFLGLHNHTSASNCRARDSINKVEDLIQYAYDIGHSGVAITEHDNLQSSLSAFNYVQKKKSDPAWKDFKLILGNEIYLCPNGVDKDHPPIRYPHFLLNALDEEGYKQIRQLSTRAWKRAYMRVMMRTPTHYQDLEDIIGVKQGHVVGSSGCLGGSLPIHLLEYRDTNNPAIYEECKQWVLYIESIFSKGYFFLEMQPSTNPDQIFVNEQLYRISNELDIPYIITTDAHYLKAEDRAIHRAFLQSQEAEREVDEFYQYAYVMSEAEIHEIMDAFLGREAVQYGIDNTMIVYNMAQEYDLHKKLRIPYMCLNYTEPNKELYLKYQTMIPSLKALYESEYEADRHLCRELTERIDADPQYQNQETYDEVEVELQTVIESSDAMGVRWSAYFLTEQNNVNIIWEKGGSIVGVARGSGAGFLILNILGITQVNPLREEVKTYYWRFLNPARAKTSVLDIDIDITKHKREAVIQAFRDVYGEDHVTQVLTLTTEKARSAILTSCRGLGISNDYAQYLASLVISDRGQTRSLKQMYYGDPEFDMKPDKVFVSEMDSHPQIWQTAQKIEGLICGVGVHAGGVILNDEDFCESMSLMKTNSGTIVSGYDLHEAESVSQIKFDVLSIALDKIQATLELLLQDGLIEWQGSLKETYEKYIGVYTLERDDPEMWKLLWDHKVLSFFQMEKESGKQAVALVKPTSVGELALINSVMRLMPPDPSAERPLDKLARFKNDISEWYKEMSDYGLTEEEQKIIEPLLLPTHGICAEQETLMRLPMIPEVGGFDLLWVDGLRKAVAKKNPKAYMQCEKEFFENAEKKNLSKNLTNYVWNVLIALQRGYGFNSSHTLSYSLIGLQELNLCYKYPMVYWNCANLLVDSGSLEEDGNTNYGKIATAMGLMKKEGVQVTKPFINEADIQFKPDAKNDRIIFGLQAIKGINATIAQEIINRRPFDSFDDFLQKTKGVERFTTSTIVQLIKAGAFEEMHLDTVTLMKQFISTLYEPVSKLTLNQLGRMVEMEVLNEEHPMYLNYRMTNYKKYVLDESRCVEHIINPDRKMVKAGYHDRLFKLDQPAQEFFRQYFSEESIVRCDGTAYVISEKQFVKELTNRYLKPLQEWMNQEENVKAYNKALFDQLWYKHASSSLEHWYMEALSCYPDKHELDAYDGEEYGVVDYFSMPEQPEVYDTYVRWMKDADGKSVQKHMPKFKINRIWGTVIDFSNDRHSITLYTPTGVVNVKFNKGEYLFYNRVLSELDGKGKKTMHEPSWFKRGTLLLVSGYRQDDMWRAYKYSDSIYKHVVNRILDVGQDKIVVQQERVQL